MKRDEWFVTCPSCGQKAPWKEPSCLVTVQVSPGPDAKFVDQHTFNILPMDPIGPHECHHGLPCGVGHKRCPDCATELVSMHHDRHCLSPCDTCLSIQARSEQNGQFQHMPGGHCPLIKRKNENGWVFVKPPLGGCPMKKNLLPAPWLTIFIKNDRLRELQAKTRLMAYGKKGIP